jgi:hypothetical protein
VIFVLRSVPASLVLTRTENLLTRNSCIPVGLFGQSSGPKTDVPVRTKFQQIFTSSQLPFELLLVLPRINHLCFIISSSFDPQHWRRCQDHNKDSPAVESLEHVPFQRAWKYRCFAMDSVPDQWPFDALQRTLN